MASAPPTTATRKRGWILAVKAAVTFALLGVLVGRMLERDGVDALLARASQLSWPWVAAAVALHFASVGAGVLRWRVLLSGRGVALPLGTALRSFLIGRFVGAFTPSTTGLDGYRLWDVGRRTNDYAASGAVILVEKLVGLVGMASVCLVLLPFGLIDRLGLAGVAVAVAMAVVALLGLSILASPRRTEAIAKLAPGPLRPRAMRIAEALGGGLGAARLALALALGIASHAFLSATFAASGLAVGITLSPLTLLAVGNAIVIAVLLPISIGGVGVREGVAVGLLVAAGDGSVTDTDAVLLALVGYLTGQVPALLGGVLLAGHADARLPQDPPPGRDAASALDGAENGARVGGTGASPQRVAWSGLGERVG